MEVGLIKVQTIDINMIHDTWCQAAYTKQPQMTRETNESYANSMTGRPELEGRIRHFSNYVCRGGSMTCQATSGTT